MIYENSTRNVFCYYWDESQGNRGANEMATNLRKYITDLDERGNIKRLLLYFDCCPGQNRNKILLTMLHETVQRCKNIESVQINFLLTGHTHMTVDSKTKLKIQLSGLLRNGVRFFRRQEKIQNLLMLRNWITQTSRDGNFSLTNTSWVILSARLVKYESLLLKRTVHQQRSNTRWTRRNPCFV